MSEQTPRWTWVLATGLALAGALALAWRPTAPALPPPSQLAAALLTFPDATSDRVAAWVGPIRVATTVSLSLHVAVPLLLVGTRAGRAVVTRLAGGRAASWRGAAVIVLLLAVATAPLRWWIGWQHAGAFGFRTSSATRFVIEALGEVALEAAVTATAVALLIRLVRARPRDWPAVATIAATAVTAVLVLVAPLLVTELLLRPLPLDDPAVRATVDPGVPTAVAPVLASSGLDLADVEVGAASVRTTRMNAVVVGFGPTRRIVVYDTLLRSPPDRVAAVVAHELAHADNRDVDRAVLASATGTLLGTLLLWTVLRGRRARWEGIAGTRPGVAGAAIAAVVVVAQVVTAPVVARESRRVEAAADEQALDATRDPAGAVALHRSFVTDDLVDPTPPTWVELLRSHPTPAARIRRAVAFAERTGLDPTPTPSTTSGGGS